MVYNATPNGEGGGIWQSGDGLARSTGNIYFVSGDGTFDANTGGQLRRQLPQAEPDRNGARLLHAPRPGEHEATISIWGPAAPPCCRISPAPTPHRVSAGKNGTIYVVDRDNMGHYNSGNDSQIVQSW